MNVKVISYVRILRESQILMSGQLSGHEPGLPQLSPTVVETLRIGSLEVTLSRWHTASRR